MRTSATESVCSKTPHSVIHAVESFAAGVLYVVAAYANATAELGIPTQIVYGRRPETPDDEELSELLHPRVSLRRVPGWGTRSARGATIGAVRAARRVAGATSGNSSSGVLHLHSTFAGVVGRLLPQRPNWRVIYTPHAYAFLAGGGAAIPARFVERRLAGRAEVIAVSEYEASIARELTAAPVTVVRNGVPIPKEVPARDDRSGQRHLRCACLGRAAPQRAPEMVAEIASGFPDARYTWVGDGPARATLERAGVEVTGWVTRGRATAFLNDADVVLHLASYDGSSLAVLEAMARGCPVVARDCPASRELLGDAGLFARTASDAVRHLERLSDNPIELHRFGAAARDRVKRLHSVGAMTEAVLRAYGIVEARG